MDITPGVKSFPLEELPELAEGFCTCHHKLSPVEFEEVKDKTGSFVIYSYCPVCRWTWGVFTSLTHGYKMYVRITDKAVMEHTQKPQPAS